MRFNQDAAVDGLCNALTVTVTDGTCRSSSKGGDDASLWEVTVAADASKPVTAALGKTTDCDADGALCTSDDTPLSSEISVTVKPTVLSAAWESLPDDHAGADTTFTAKVRLSDAVDVTGLCDAFEVTNGTCKSSAKVGGDAALWEITVEPDGADDVSLSLGITTDCAATGAVCTAADEPLSYGVFAVVARRALTVSLVSIPDYHGGVDTTFTVGLRLSEAVDVADLCGYVSLLGGRDLQQFGAGRGRREPVGGRGRPRRRGRRMVHPAGQRLRPRRRGVHRGRPGVAIDRQRGVGASAPQPRLPLQCAISIVRMRGRFRHHPEAHRHYAARQAETLREALDDTA